MLKMIDLFAGIGGIRIGFENNKVKCVMSSEIDKKACETYKLNFGDVPKGDIKLLTEKDLPECDIITAGCPCQPFSIGGLRKGFEDTRGTLFFEVERLLSICKPKAFLLENVAGLVNHDGGKTLNVIEQKLKRLGYIFKWEIMNAKDYGVPQNRARWYCIGFRKDLKVSFSNKSKGVPNYKFPDKRDLLFKVEDILEKNTPIEYKVSSICEGNINTHLPDYKKKKNVNSNIILANEIRKSRCNFRSDGISPCLTAKMGTGGNNVPVYVQEMRKLTEKECLMLMGFPKKYKIKGNNASSYKQIGNSVIVPIIDLLAKEMVRVLEEIK